MQRQQDEELLALFHLMDSEEREFFIQIGRSTTEGRQTRPALSLVVSDTCLAGTLKPRRVGS